MQIAQRKTRNYTCGECGTIIEALPDEELRICPECGSEQIEAFRPDHRFSQRAVPARKPAFLVPSNLSLFRCRYCGAVFAFVSFDAREPDVTHYYHRRRDPAFCPSCGKPL